MSARARIRERVVGPVKTVSFMGSMHFFAFLARNKSIDDKLINSVHARGRARSSAGRIDEFVWETVRTYTWEIVHRKCKRVAENFGQHPLILACRGQHPVMLVRVCPCCKVAFHPHRTVLFPNSTSEQRPKTGNAVLWSGRQIGHHRISLEATWDLKDGVQENKITLMRDVWLPETKKSVWIWRDMGRAAIEERTFRFQHITRQRHYIWYSLDT